MKQAEYTIKIPEAFHDIFGTSITLSQKYHMSMSYDHVYRAMIALAEKHLKNVNVTFITDAEFRNDIYIQNNKAKIRLSMGKPMRKSDIYNEYNASKHLFFVMEAGRMLNKYVTFTKSYVQSDDNDLSVLSEINPEDLFPFIREAARTITYNYKPPEDSSN